MRQSSNRYLLKSTHRTDTLIRDAVHAMQASDFSRQFADWLKDSAVTKQIDSILQEDLGQLGFHHIKDRLVTNIKKTDLEQIFGHVQSHYLPKNWKSRRHFLGDYGRLRVYLADDYDIFVSKLSSKLEKHQDDLRVMSASLKKDKVKERLLGDGKCFLDSEFDRPTIEANWHFIYREALIV